MKKLATTVTNALGSNWFLFAVVCFFVFEALWITFSAVYPMAFDEEFHLTLTALYAEHTWPFLPADAASNGQFGPVARDPSFLYHWLLSFPYRLFQLFSDSQTAAVIFLRLINVALFSAGMLLFYRLLRRVGVSPAFSNVALALFVLIPVVPLMAGQINYDNLLMIFIAWTCLLVVDFCRDIQERKFEIRRAALLLIVCIFGSLVKYAFVPIALIALAFCVATAWQAFRQHQTFGRLFRQSYKKLSLALRLGLAGLILAGLVLGMQRYGVNLVRYGTPLPDCAAVLSVEQCLNFPPWGRNYIFEQERQQINPSPLHYTQRWLENLHQRLFYMINGPHHGYQNYPPPPLLANTATVIALLALVAVVIFGRRIFSQRPILLALVLMAFFYALALWINNYLQYLETTRVVAVNGRYLVPILLPLAAVAGAAFSTALRPLPQLKPLLAIVAIVLFLQGGGLTSYLVRSDPTWHWPNLTVQEVNRKTKKLLDPLIYQGGTQYKD